MNIYIRNIGALIYFLFEIFLVLTTISDPGVVTKQYYLENYQPDKTVIKNFRICSKCNIVMDLDKGTEHCVECGICVMNNDHHCPWTSKCVGKGNIFYFNAMLVMISIVFFYVIFAFVFAKPKNNI